MKRFKTSYPGVSYIVGMAAATGKPEKIFYIRYRKDGKEIEEKAGRQVKDKMTAAKAAIKRGERIKGNQPSNKEKRQAERAKKEAEAGRWTIKRLWKQYKKTKPGLKGFRTDENRFEKHLKPAFGKKEPKEILPLDIKRVELKLLKTHKPATVKNVLELLGRIINFGEKNRLCPGLNFKISKPEVHNEKTEDLSSAQLSRLLAAIEADKHPQAGNLMLMALYTGMRRGELFKLKWSDVDFQKGFISIRDPKGGADQKIPLNDAARQILKNHPRHKQSPFMFPGRKGEQRTDINKAVNAIKKAAKLPKDFRPLHGLRHVYASMLASSGEVDLYLLQKLLTHKDPKLTQRYAHLRDDALKRAANLAGDIVNGILNQEKRTAADSEVKNQ